MGQKVMIGPEMNNALGANILFAVPLCRVLICSNEARHDT
jgi:hypothetical protein